MAKSKPGSQALGRGLDALLGVGTRDAKAALDPAPARLPEPQATPTEIAREAVPPAGLRMVGVDLIERSPFQPRRVFEEEALEELAQSIRAHGVLQPIVVRPLPGQRFELVAGERRWRAAQRAELHEVPVVVREIDDRTALAIALVENLQREDLNPIEEAVALQRLVSEFEMTHETAAEAVGRSRSAVTNLLRLLGLESAVREMLAGGKIEMGHARALLGLSGELQVAVAREVIVGQLNVRATERRVKEAQGDAKPRSGSPAPDPDVERLRRRMAERLGTRVDLKSRGGKGTITLHYGSHEELDGLLERLGVGHEDV